LIQKFEEHNSDIPLPIISSMSFSPNSKYLALAGGVLHTIDIMEIGTGKNSLELYGHSNFINAIDYDPIRPVLISGSADNTVRFWDLMSEAETIKFRSHTGSVSAISLHPKKELLASIGDDHILHLWNTRTGKQVDEVNLNIKFSAQFGNIYFLPGLDEIFFTADNCFYSWKYDSKQENSFKNMTCEVSWINKMCISPNEKRIVVTGPNNLNENKIFLYELESGNLIWSFNTDKRISALQISPDNKIIAYCIADSLIHIINLESGHEICRISGHSNTIYSIAFNPDCSIMASASKDGTVRFWNLKTWDQIKQIGPYNYIPGALTFNLNGDYCSYGTNQGYISIINMDTMEEIQAILAHGGPINCLSFSPDDQLLYSGSSDGTIRSWEYKKLNRLISVA
jgi:WD40 repeat protein